MHTRLFTGYNEVIIKCNIYKSYCDFRISEFHKFKLLAEERKIFNISLYDERIESKRQEKNKFALYVGSSHFTECFHFKIVNTFNKNIIIIDHNSLDIFKELVIERFDSLIEMDKIDIAKGIEPRDIKLLGKFEDSSIYITE